MLITFDESTFKKDLDTMVAHQDRFDSPLVVLPAEKDVKFAEKEYGDDAHVHITFISFDRFYSYKWLADDTKYDHIDFFRIDKVLLGRSCDVPIGRATVARTKKKAKKEEETA